MFEGLMRAVIGWAAINVAILFGYSIYGVVRESRRIRREIARREAEQIEMFRQYTGPRSIREYLAEDEARRANVAAADALIRSIGGRVIGPQGE